MSDAGVVHFVVPDGIDDPARVSGGNIWDRRVRDGLREIGWTVRMAPVATDAAADLARFSDGALVLVDGLVANRSPAALEVEADRLRIVVVAHMVAEAFPSPDPRAVEGERRALRAARVAIATSEWTRSELVRRGLVPHHRIVVATPGAAAAEPAVGTPEGVAMLCVGAVAPHKGQDTLVAALAALAALAPEAPWTCTVAGSLTADPGFAHEVAARAEGAGISGRITMAGILTGSALDAAYRRTDLLVAPSRTESYGMAIADALGRGIPVVATSVGGIPQTVAPGRAAVLVPPGQPRALADVLGRWMSDPALRARMTQEARRARGTLPRWSDTAEQVARTLAGMT